MRKDFNGSIQIGSGFATEEEKESWAKAEEKDLSNITHPFSGSERNRLFVNGHADSFLDLSGISGVDSPADGRVSVWLDMDRDGRQDLAVVNSNRPMLQLYRNGTGELATSTKQPTTPYRKNGNFVALRLVGGNNGPESNPKFSNRDGWGARVTLATADRTITREHLCGQGFSGQNSSTMLIGLGEVSTVDKLSINWPSGIQQDFTDVPAGKLIILYERAESGSSDGITMTDYTPSPIRSIADTSSETTPRPGSEYSRLPVELLSQSTASSTSSSNATASASEAPQLTVLTTMASWCVACAKHQPQMKAMSQQFDPSTVSFVGFPGDPDDPADDFQKFVERLQIDYPIVSTPDNSLRATISSILDAGDGADILPSTIVIDQRGSVVATHKGIPTASELRQYLSLLKPGSRK